MIQQKFDASEMLLLPAEQTQPTGTQPWKFS